MDDFIKVDKELFFEIKNSYPSKLTHNFFMGWHEWYDMELVNNSFERGTFEHIYPAKLFRINVDYGAEDFYVHQSLMKY